MNDLPANDAFTLNSRTHRHRSPSQSSQSPFNSQSRSPPPPSTISQFFEFGEKKNTNANTMNPGIRQRKLSVSSKTSADRESASKQNGNGEVIANGHSLKERSKTAKKIDWEIPRKILHSSIGML